VADEKIKKIMKRCQREGKEEYDPHETKPGHSLNKEMEALIEAKDWDVVNDILLNYEGWLRHSMVDSLKKYSTEMDLGPVIAALTFVLTEETAPYTKQRTMVALGKIAKRGGDVTSAIPVLVSALKDNNEDTRTAASEALVKIGTQVIPDVIDVLKHENWHIQSKAGKTLEKIAENNSGYDWKETVPDLIDALNYKDRRTRHMAARVFNKIGFDKIPELKDLVLAHLSLRDKDRTYPLVQIGKPAVPYLLDTLKSEDWDVRQKSVKALRGIAEEIGDFDGDDVSALKIVKDSVTIVMEFYKKKKDRYSLNEKRHLLKRFAQTTEYIHIEMNNPLDKKEPMKWQKPTAEKPAKKVNKRITAK